MIHGNYVYQLILFADIDSTCSEFDHGSALHIAASNLAFEAVKILLQNGANATQKDEKERTALGMACFM